MSRVDEILDFWFGSTRRDQRGYGERRSIWFRKDFKFDAEIRDRFLINVQQAAIGQLDHWRESAASCLALILLLDQFPRNLFRNSAQAYATDAQALALAEWAIAQGFDQQLLPVQRWFIYLPFEHSENLDHQDRAVELFRQVAAGMDDAAVMSASLRHRAIIQRFGRFPHRNQALGRVRTPEEAEFLKQPGSSF